MTESFFTVREAAAILKISPKTLYGLTAARTVPFTKVGKHIRFSQAHIDAIAKAGEQPVIEPPTQIQIAARRRGRGTGRMTHPPSGPSTPPPPSGPKDRETGAAA